MGAAIVKRLAAEGATVVFTYVKGAAAAAALVAELTAKGEKASAVAADSADPAAVIASVNETVAQHGRIDILVNNAGTAVLKAFTEYTLEDYEHVMGVNTRAVFVGTQAALPHMSAGSRIITIGSCMADRVIGPHGTLYRMSK